MLLDILKYAFSKLIPGLAALGMVVLLLGAVGPEVYGRFSLGLVTALTIASLSVSWLNQAQLRYASRFALRPGLLAAVVTEGRRLALVLASLLTALAALAGLLPAGMASWLVTWILVAAVVVQLTRIAAWQSRIRPGEVALLEILRACGMLLLPWSLAWLAADHRLLLAGAALAYGLSLLRPAPWSAPAALPPRRLWAQLRRFWRYGWPMSLWLGAMMALQVADRYLIQHFHGFAATGGYASLFDLLLRAYALAFMPITWAVHPRIMTAWNAGRPDQARRLLTWALGAQLVLFLPLVAGFVLTGPLLLRTLLPDLDPALARLVLPLSIGGLLWQMALLAHKPLEVTGRTRWMLTGMLLALGLDVGLNLWGLPRFGMDMAAWAYLAAGAGYLLFVTIVALWGRSSRHLPLPWGAL